MQDPTSQTTPEVLPQPRKGILKGFSSRNSKSGARSNDKVPQLPLHKLDLQSPRIDGGKAWTSSNDRKLPLQDDSSRQRGLEFRQPGGWSWKNIRRRLLLASTGSPSSVERGSETSEASHHSRQAAYSRNAGHGREQHSRLHSHPEKQVHMEGIDDEDGDGEVADWTVDQVVVDNELWDKDGNLLQQDEDEQDESVTKQQSHSGGGTGAALNGNDRVSNSGREGTATAFSETAGSLLKTPHFRAFDGVFAFFRGWLIPKIIYFFEPKFGDPEKEDNFRKERWYNNKRHAFFGCVFLIINWALIMGLVKMYAIYQDVLYYGVFTLLTWPLPVMVAFDWPRKYPMCYSAWASAATMCLGYIGVISMYSCHFLRDGAEACGGQTYLLVTYYSTAFCVVALFSLSVNRLMMAIAQLGLFGLVCGTLLMDSGGYARNFINFIIFTGFMQYLHYGQEKTERRMYTLRTQLKISYRAQQKAQIAEKKANNSKKRFISYIFHEVRVPLNTAYLAFQNLQHEEVFDKRDEDQMVEVYALETSLQQVQQVLNDVLDLQRMDAGKFESSNQPFQFHRAIAALVAGLKVATAAKRLSLNVSLDERIDNLPQSIDWQGGKASFMIGDEIRLRQVLTNIASNSCKFNPEGRGGISISTKLIYPEVSAAKTSTTGTAGGKEGSRHRKLSAVGNEHWPEDGSTPMSGIAQTSPESNEGTEKTYVARLSQDRDLEQGIVLAETEKGITPQQPAMVGRTDSHGSNDSDKLAKRDCVIIRVEISDNGPGIKPSDMVDLRVFSAFTQTETGRVQGGKGTGLGLAIVRAIVQLGQGKLGVKSSKNGSTFWLEFRYPLATASEVYALQEPATPMSLNAPSPLPKLTRPPVKPYKDGESSYSQYSASRLEATSAAVRSIPPSPAIMEVDERPFSSLSLGRASGADTKLGARMPSNESRGASGSISSLPTGTGTVSPTGALNAIDTISPFTSEQWAASTERSIMPAMNVTAPTPSSLSSRTNLSLNARRTPTPPPDLPNSKAEQVEMTSMASQNPPTTLEQAAPPATAPQVLSPVGEAAFTPLTRAEAATTPSPMAELPTAGLSGVALAVSPLSKAGAALAPALPGAATPAGERQLRAIVIDDDPLTRKLMGRMMARLGCTVEDAENGALFLDILLGTEGNPPKFFDIAVCDNAMPVMTGEQAVRHLREAGRQDLVVGATGNAMKQDQQSYIDAGLDYILTKPISMKDIKRVLGIAGTRRALVDAMVAEAAGGQTLTS